MNIWHIMDSFFYSKNATKKVIFYYLKWVSYFLLIILVALFLYFGQQQLISLRETAAQKSLAQIITRFREYQDGTLDEATLGEFHKTIEIEQEQYQNSFIAPYFANIQAEVFIKEGKLSEAVQVLDAALLLSNDPITQSILATKRALILLDFNPDIGIKQLKELITNEDNVISDIAQFYLGRYYWVHNDIDSAKEIWNNFVANQSQYRISQSPYANEVDMMLSSLGIKS